MEIVLCLSFIIATSVIPPEEVTDGLVESQDAMRIEANVAAALHAIESGDVIITYEDTLARRREKIRIRFNRDSSRFDSLGRFSIEQSGAADKKSANNNAGEELLRSRIETPSEIIIREKGKLPDGSPVATYVAETGQSQSMAGNFDIRLLGSVPCPSGLLYRKQLTDYFGRKDRMSSEVSIDLVAGVECLKSSYRRKDDRILTFWVTPLRSWGIVRAEIDAPIGNDRRLVQRVESVNELHTGNVWFPKTVVFSENSGSGFIIRERWNIESAEINIKPGNDPFTIESLDLAKGERLVGSRMQSKSGVKAWYGQNAVDLKEYKESLAALRYDRSFDWRYWCFILNIFVFCVACVVCGVLVIRRRHPPRQ